MNSRSSRRKPASQAVAVALESIERWEQWVEELDRHALDPFEYEALLSHRAGLDEQLVLAGSELLNRRCEELDAWFDDLTVEDPSSPFLPGGSISFIPDDAKVGRWWSRVPSDPERRAYTFGRP